MGIEPMTNGLLDQRSTDWAMRPCYSGTSSNLRLLFLLFFCNRSNFRGTNQQSRLKYFLGLLFSPFYQKTLKLVHSKELTFAQRTQKKRKEVHKKGSTTWTRITRIRTLGANQLH